MCTLQLFSYVALPIFFVFVSDTGYNTPVGVHSVMIIIVRNRNIDLKLSFY